MQIPLETDLNLWVEHLDFKLGTFLRDVALQKVYRRYSRISIGHLAWLLAFITSQRWDLQVEIYKQQTYTNQIVDIGVRFVFCRVANNKHIDFPP